MVFLLIILGLPIADVLWWWRTDRMCREIAHARVWRTLVAVFVAVQLAGFITVIGSRFVGIVPHVPSVILAAIYLWHLLVIPFIAIVWLISLATRAVLAMARTLNRSDPGAEAAPSAADATSRRAFLRAAAAAAPPVLLAASLGDSIPELGRFRINRLTIPLRELPPDLDGMTIAHVSDVHVGRFTRAKLLPRIADATNALRADLVLLTGDLIDFSLADLPAGIDLVRRLDPRHGLFMVEGNHDLFEGREEFERRVLAAGIPLLLNQSRTVRIRGIDVVVGGIRWGLSGSRTRGGNVDQHVRATLPVLRPADRGAFPILLAHHPHAFDLAADSGVPLTLAGHTHGGQLMLSSRLGAGPMMFKYWSGLYRRNDAALVVSNGVGNWFPLRINAPAEIVHITLRKA